MSANPRSQVLIQFSTESPPTTFSFTCPAGCVTLVKSLYAMNVDSAAGSISFGVVHPGMLREVWLSLAVLEPQTPYSWEGWLVLNPGDGITLTLNHAAMSGWVSGAVLTGPPPFPPNV